jgi:hypothetical protein
LIHVTHSKPIDLKLLYYNIMYSLDVNIFIFQIQKYFPFLSRMEADFETSVWCDILIEQILYTLTFFTVHDSQVLLAI